MAKRKRSNLLIWILVGVIVVLVAGVIWRQKTKPKGEKVTTEKVEKRTIREMVAASGKVFPQTEVKISSDVSGEVVQLSVEEGDSVVTGQLLAKIDPDAYQSQVEQGIASVNNAKAAYANARSQVETAKAQREQIVAQLENAREIHRRNTDLRKDGVVSQADFDASQSNLRALEANLRSAEASVRAAEESAKAANFSVDRAEAALKELRTALRRTTIYAPNSGIISMLNVEAGERVVGTAMMSGTELIRIANLNNMEVRVDVSENDIPRVSLSDEVEIEVDAYIDRKFKGRVTQIANSANSAASAASLTSDQVTNFEVRINIDPESYADLITPEKPYPFRPGMSASVEINTKTMKNILSVPIQAVTTRDPEEKESEGETEEAEAEANIAAADLLEVIFLVRADTVDMVEVKTGIQDDTHIQIVSGLEEGQEIVTGPYAAISRKLKEGDQIRVVKEDELFADNN